MSQSIPDSKPTLDQRRARHAWEAVQDAKNKTGVHQKREPKKFGGQAKKLPTRIMASGLGQALAFLHAKGYADGLLQEVADWVLDKRSDPNSRKPEPDRDALIKAILTKDSDFLRRATDETLAYLQWLNRFAEAEGLTEGE
jgi:CRISPR-associated protein Cmr5